MRTFSYRYCASSGLGATLREGHTTEARESRYQEDVIAERETSGVSDVALPSQALRDC